MIFCAKKEGYVDQEMTCIKKNCPHYNPDVHFCDYEEEIIEEVGNG